MTASTQKLQNANHLAPGKVQPAHSLVGYPDEVAEALHLLSPSPHRSPSVLYDALSPHNDRTPTVDETFKLNITDTRHDSSPRQRSTKHAREGWRALVAPAWTAVGLKLENMLKLARVVGAFVSILFVLYSSSGSIIVLYTLRPITCTRPNGTVLLQLSTVCSRMGPSFCVSSFVVNTRVGCYTVERHHQVP